MYIHISYIHKNRNLYTSHLIIFCRLIWFEVKFRTLGPFAILPETPLSFNGSVVEKNTVFKWDVRQLDLVGSCRYSESSPKILHRSCYGPNIEISM